MSFDGAGPVGAPDPERLGWLVDADRAPTDPATLLGNWQPGGAVWYAHACCGAGSDAPSTFTGLFAKDSALDRMLSEVAGLPGAPARTTQVAGAYSSAEGGAGQAVTISGRPPVLRMPLGTLNLPGPCGFCDGPVTAAQFAAQLRLLSVHAFVGA